MIQIAEIALERAPHPFWRALAQVGVRHACGILPHAESVDWETTVEQPWDYGPLVKYRDQLAEAGLELVVMEDVPPMQSIRLGRAGREEEIEHFCTLLTNLGRIGVPVLVYDWWTLGWQRTSFSLEGRGGARVSGYDGKRRLDAPMTPLGSVEAEDLWSNLKYFLKGVLPAAERAEVRLAMHPEDPPLPSLRGIARIMWSVDAYRRLLELVPSDANGITLCQGNFALMTDDLPAVIREFGSLDKIFFVHFRDVRGTADAFVETFHDEGQTDMLACLRAYHETGYEGFLRTDHVPTLEGDAAEIPGYSHNARLHAVGYTQGLLEAVQGRPPARNSVTKTARKEQ